MRLLLLICSACLVAPVARADVPDAQRAEVEHLLGFVLHSSCVFIRNGREYGGERAHSHILRKYRYFRDEIDTTERFIELSASQSLVSKRPYQISCDGRPRPSREVLLEELARFRTSR